MLINRTIFSLFFVLTFAVSCFPVSKIDIRLHSQLIKDKTPIPNASWVFNNENDYEFNSNYVEISNGTAKLKPVTTIFNTDATFNTGIHSETIATNNTLTIPSKGTGNPSVTSILPEVVSNLEAYYRMDGNWNDSSTHGRDATVSTGTPTFAKTWLGTGAAEFNGTSSLIVSPSANLEPKKISVSLWFRSSLKQSSTSNATQTLIASSMGANLTSNSFLVGVNNNTSPNLGSIFIEVDGVNLISTNFSSANLVPVNTWMHVVATYDGATVKCYLNGEEIINAPYAGGDNEYIAGSTSWRIARRWPEGAPLFNPKYLEGSLDEISIWDTVLTQTQAKKIYQEQLIGQFSRLTASWAPKKSSLIGYWNIDGTWLDASANKYKGTPNVIGYGYTTDSKVGPLAGIKTVSSLSTVSFGNMTPLNAISNFTVSGWYKFDLFENGKMLWSRDSGPTNNIKVLLNGTSGDVLIGLANGVADTSLKTTSNLLQPNIWYYITVVYDGSQSSDFTKLKLYVNGQPISLVAQVVGIPTVTGTNSTHMTYAQFQGSFDDFAIWNSSLTQADIISIYDRHQQPFSASFDSPIIDMGASVPWTSLTAKTTLPFYKEIPGLLQSETALDYSGSPRDFSNGLKALWHFNESSGTSLSDATGNGNTINLSGSAVLGSAGKLGTSVSFNGTSSYGETSTTPLITNTLSVCTWVNTSGAQAAGTRVLEQGGCNTNDGYGIELNNASSGKYDFVVWAGGAGTCTAACRATSATNIIPEAWNYICGTYNGVTSKIYINGKYENSATCSLSMNTQPLTIGKAAGGNSFLKGNVDETALWSRALSDNDIKELYLRGANRVKYQVRSCTQPNCSDATWIGPSGTSMSYFSELYNNDAINTITGKPEGNVLASALDLTFADFPLLARPANNRYFQFRTFLESDDQNNLCSGLPCMPIVNSISVDQSSLRYLGVSTIISKNAITTSSLQRLTTVTNRDCARFQLSLDNGVTWNWWDGSTWAAATDSITNANAISDFTSENLLLLGATSYKFKAYLPAATDFTAGCELSSVNLFY